MNLTEYRHEVNEALEEYAERAEKSAAELRARLLDADRQLFGEAMLEQPQRARAYAEPELRPGPDPHSQRRDLWTMPYTPPGEER